MQGMRRSKQQYGSRLTTTSENVEDPAGMWEVLKKGFDGTASEARQTQLAIDFHGLRLESSEKVSAAHV